MPRRVGFAPWPAGVGGGWKSSPSEADGSAAASEGSEWMAVLPPSHGVDPCGPGNLASAQVPAKISGPPEAFNAVVRPPSAMGLWVKNF